MDQCLPMLKQKAAKFHTNTHTQTHTYASNKLSNKQETGKCAIK